MLHFECSNCGAPLADILVSPTDKNIKWPPMYANCPHCGDKSYEKEFEGLFSLVNDENTQRYTIVENFDIETNPIILQTVKVQDYAS